MPFALHVYVLALVVLLVVALRMRLHITQLCAWFSLLASLRGVSHESQAQNA